MGGKLERTEPLLFVASNRHHVGLVDSHNVHFPVLFLAVADVTPFETMFSPQPMLLFNHEQG
jgi:hypothetical protein